MCGPHWVESTFWFLFQQDDATFAEFCQWIFLLDPDAERPFLITLSRFRLRLDSQVIVVTRNDSNLFDHNHQASLDNLLRRDALAGSLRINEPRDNPVLLGSLDHSWQDFQGARHAVFTLTQLYKLNSTDDSSCVRLTLGNDVWVFQACFDCVVFTLVLVPWRVGKIRTRSLENDFITPRWLDFVWFFLRDENEVDFLLLFWSTRKAIIDFASIALDLDYTRDRLRLNGIESSSWLKGVCMLREWFLMVSISVFAMFYPC